MRGKKRFKGILRLRSRQTLADVRQMGNHAMRIPDADSRAIFHGASSAAYGRASRPFVFGRRPWQAKMLCGIAGKDHRTAQSIASPEIE